MEEEVEKGKTQKQITIIIILVVVVASLGIYLYPVLRGITANEGLEVVNKIIEERYGNTTVYYGSIIGSSVKANGRAPTWSYSFAIALENSTYDSLYIKVHSDKSYDIYGPGNLDIMSDNYILEWQIDSDRAVSIAREDLSVKSFLVNIGEQTLTTVN